MTRRRISPPSHSPRNTSRRSRSTSGVEPEPLGQRRRRLVRALQARHVDRRDPLAARDEPIAHAQRLLVTLVRERRIAVTVHQRERLTLDGGRRLAVAHEEDLAGARRRREAVLAELARLGGELGRLDRSVVVGAAWSVVRGVGHV